MWTSAYTELVEVTFEVAGSNFKLPEPQATVLAEKLRLFARRTFRRDEELLAKLGADDQWCDGALPAANLIEAALVGGASGHIRPEGRIAEAIHWVLRLSQLEPDPHGATGLRDALAPASVGS